MCYTGIIKDGVVVLDNGAELAEGSIVRVELVSPPVSEASNDAEIPTLYEQLEPLIGSIEGLPPDMAAQHDHYLHGRPKR